MGNLMRQEIEVRDIIPAIRREYAKAFISKGLSQRKTAQILNLTEAAVSNYIHDKRGSSVPLPKHVIVKIEESAERVVKYNLPINSEMQRISDLDEIMEIVCRLHKEKGCVPDDCSVCISSRNEVMTDDKQ